MTAEALLDRLRSLGASPSVVGDRLRVECAPGTLTPDLKAALIEHKQELVNLLRPGGDPPPERCPTCGGSLFWQSIAYGPWTCLRCHPPQARRLVARWSSPEVPEVEEGLP